jgi:antitoxin (DNA-binding transcriptional repressor) of toxin-antitoxin stability system
MREQVISVTQAARKFADCVNRVHYQGASFILEKNGVPVARLGPVVSAPSAKPEHVVKAPGETQNAIARQHEGKEAEPTFAVAEAQEKNRQLSKTPRRPTLNW